MAEYALRIREAPGLQPFSMPVKRLMYTWRSWQKLRRPLLKLQHHVVVCV